MDAEHDLKIAMHRIAELEAENKALREAVQAVVQERSWNAIDKAEALLKEGGDE